MDAALRAKLSRAIAEVLGAPFSIKNATAATGGCIHQSYRLDCDSGRYFLKLSDAAGAANLQAEADGLQAIRATGMRVPGVIALGESGDTSFLLLEFLDLVSDTSPRTQRALGQALAHMHEHTGDRYGWAQANFIGLTPQSNTWHTDWPSFWATQRLRPQLDLALQNGYGSALEKLGDALLDILPALLEGHRPKPALLHGDLWSGNAGALANGTPVIFDPAVYYGDPEADLAMTELFGGFASAFYDGYREVRRIDDGYASRKPLYNLYHVLNHLNLFGGTYLHQSQRLMQGLLAEAR